MKVAVFQLFFKAQGDVLVPTDQELHALAVKFAEEEMAKPLDFTQYRSTWVACEIDAEGRPIRGLGLLCMQLKADFPVCRFIDNAAVVKLVQRANDALHDQGARGTEALVFISPDEGPEQKCPNWQSWMEVFGLKPANRYSLVVK